MIKITKCPEPSLQAIKLLRINSGVGHDMQNVIEELEEMKRDES